MSDAAIPFGAHVFQVRYGPEKPASIDEPWANNLELAGSFYSLAMGAVLPTVDNAAHVGGLLGGAAAGWLLVRPFEPAARAEARPGQVAAAVGVICAALAVLVALRL